MFGIYFLKYLELLCFSGRGSYCPQRTSRFQWSFKIAHQHPFSSLPHHITRKFHVQCVLSSSCASTKLQGDWKLSYAEKIWRTVSLHKTHNFQRLVGLQRNRDPYHATVNGNDKLQELSKCNQLLFHDQLQCLNYIHGKAAYNFYDITCTVNYVTNDIPFLSELKI